MAARIEIVIADPVFDPAAPSVQWTHKQLDAFAAEQGLDVGEARTKAEKLAVPTDG